MKQDKTVELFGGKRSFSDIADEEGFETWSTDIQGERHDLIGDILNRNVQKKVMEKVNDPEVIFVWMSPVCKRWSLAAGNTYWDEFRQPNPAKEKECLEAIRMIMFCRLVADTCIKKNKYFLIENPMGRITWIMDNKYLKRVWYCQYGDIRAKPTNLFTNVPGFVPKTCYNGNKDCHHEPAPRGSKTGTQGIKGNRERSIVPKELCKEICRLIKKAKK